MTTNQLKLNLVYKRHLLGGLYSRGLVRSGKWCLYYKIKLNLVKKITLIGGVVSLFIFPAVSFASFNYNLQYGMSGPTVSQLQNVLYSDGCLTTQPTGYFGLLTLKAVECYQTNNGISSTGYVGALTRRLLNSISTSSTVISPTPVQSSSTNNVSSWYQSSNQNNTVTTQIQQQNEQSAQAQLQLLASEPKSVNLVQLSQLENSANQTESEMQSCFSNLPSVSQTGADEATFQAAVDGCEPYETELQGIYSQIEAIGTTTPSQTSMCELQESQINSQLEQLRNNALRAENGYQTTGTAYIGQQESEEVSSAEATEEIGMQSELKLVESGCQ